MKDAYEGKMEFDEWCDMHSESIDIELAENGADREMDFDLEKEYKTRYEKQKG